MTILKYLCPFKIIRVFTRTAIYFSKRLLLLLYVLLLLLLLLLLHTNVNLLQ
jgi:hypothetical protein